MLLAVTLNPAIDRVLSVEAFEVGGTFRTPRVTAQAGGKGLNVARAAYALGLPVLATGPIAGPAGEYFAAIASREAIRSRWFPISHGETRTATIIVHPPQDATVVNECGPDLGPEDWQRISDEIAQMAREADIISLSGSLPGEVTDPHPFAAMVARLLQADRTVAIDTHSGALQAVLGEPLWLLKVNAAELAAARGTTVGDRDGITALAARVQADGPQQVLVTDGARGAGLVTADAGWWATPPAVDVVSSIGSGDTLLAAFCAAWQDHPAPQAALPEILRFAIAAGTANVLTAAPGDVNRETVEQMVARVRIEQFR